MLKNVRLILLACLMQGIVYAQNLVPQLINYQAIARTASGAVFVNKQLGIRISVLEGSSSGAVQYSERHVVTTNSFGLFTLKIGSGTPLSNTFASITWSTANQYLKVELDPEGGTNYTDLGTNELLSVPYALYAQNGGSGGTQGPPGPEGPQGPQGEQGPAGTPAPEYEAGPGIGISGNVISNTGDRDSTNDIVIGSVAGGDLSGFYPDPSVVKIQGIPVSPDAPTEGQVLQFNATNNRYEPVTPASGGSGGATGSHVYSSSSIALTSNFQLIPGMQATINVPEGGMVLVNTQGGIYSDYTGTAGAAVEFRLLFDGQLPAVNLGSAYEMHTLYHTAGVRENYLNWSFSHLYTNVSGGSHTIELQSKRQILAGNPAISVGGGPTDINQGLINVLIYAP